MAQIGLTGAHARGRISSRSSLTSRDSRVLRRFHPATGCAAIPVYPACPERFPREDAGRACLPLVAQPFLPAPSISGAVRGFSHGAANATVYPARSRPHAPFSGAASYASEFGCRGAALSRGQSRECCAPAWQPIGVFALHSGNIIRVVGVAQLVERRTVAPNVAGSIPVSHPNFPLETSVTLGFLSPLRFLCYRPATSFV